MLFVRKVSQKAGLPPGTLVHVGERKVDRARIHAVHYDGTILQEKDLETPGECLGYKDLPTLTWVNVDGLHEVDLIQGIGECFDLHPLVLEDIVQTGQRPKVEDYGDYLFVVLKMLSYEDGEEGLRSDQMSLVLGKHYLLTFQEAQGDVLEPVRKRLRGGQKRIREWGPDYLAYALMDAVVDLYFVVLERIGEEVEVLGDRLITDPGPETLQSIHRLKRDLLALRKSVWPLREVLAVLERGESPLIKPKTRLYFRDVYDHTIQVIDTVETLRDMVAGMLDVYLSSISNRLNEIMKVVAIIATVFMPMTLIAGIYGMNFHYMPELKWRWGYFGALGLIAAVGLVTLWFFKKRRWL